MRKKELTTKEALKYLHIGRMTLRYHFEKGDITPTGKNENRSYMWAIDDLDALKDKMPIVGPYVPENRKIIEQTDEMMAITEVAEFLGVSVGTARGYMGMGVITPVGRKKGRRGNPSFNDPDNLEIFDRSEHSKLHQEMLRRELKLRKRVRVLEQLLAQHSIPIPD